MQGPLTDLVLDFEWDERNMSYVSRHKLTPEIADEVLHDEALLFYNKPGRTGSHALIGSALDGTNWVIILLPLGGHGRWRPVNGWDCSDSEKRFYERQKGLRP
jgi:hypothetical protein